MDVSGDEDRVEQRPGDLVVHAIGEDRLADLADGGEAPLLRVESTSYVASLETPPVPMMVIAPGRVAKRDGIAFGAIGQDVNAGTDRSEHRGGMPPLIQLSDESSIRKREV